MTPPPRPPFEAGEADEGAAAPFPQQAAHAAPESTDTPSDARAVDDDDDEDENDDEDEHDGHENDDADTAPGAAAPPRQGGLHESLRRVLVGGASALTSTEEGLRTLLTERRLPKEALAALAHQTERTRKEVGRLVGREFKRALARVDVARELRRALVGLRLDVRASIRVREDKAAPADSPHSPPASAAPPSGSPSPDSAPTASSQGGPSGR